MPNLHGGWCAGCGCGLGIAEMFARAWQSKLLPGRARDLRGGAFATEYGNGDRGEESAIFRGGCEGGLDLRPEGEDELLRRAIRHGVEKIGIVPELSKAIGAAVMELKCPHCGS